MNISSDRDIELSNVRMLLCQRERELRELHHRIANSLQLASGFLTFQRKNSADPDLQAALGMAAQRLSAVGKLHRHLYAHSEASQVDFKEFLEEVCPEIADSTGLECDIQAESIAVSGDMAQNLAIVINEFAMNASKHAYGGRPGGKLKIESRRYRHSIRLVVADGGKGLDEDFDPASGKGLGMIVVRSIVQQLGGTLRAMNDHGARFIVTAPLT
ncbi:MAG: sensor histidine kinase [Caulobacterales bacterium]